MKMKIDIGDEDAIVFKIESHNHPSYIEPYQGAATGVGGILRDVFTMGARPIVFQYIWLSYASKNKKFIKRSCFRNRWIRQLYRYSNCSW